eukprot:GHRR01004343.1.p1 GENE.GHRR01004343.1~~GHRR01004343.1.p1  ORF type:complete len:229 (+),score=48.10 GHRR01004343.1:208-894(+)
MPSLDDYPTKNPNGVMPSDPTHFFPLTRDNMRTNLPMLLRQFLSYDLAHLKSYKALTEKLYTPSAKFQYPLAEMDGKAAVQSFWVLFLIGRAVQLNDVHSLHIDCTWDPETLQAVVQIEAWQHLLPFAWLDKLLRLPGWKVWTTQVFQFEESPQDGPGALRVVFQEELMDQMVFLGLIPIGLYAWRTDPGTPLHSLRTGIRRVVGRSIHAYVEVVERLLVAGGLMPKQ